METKMKNSTKAVLAGALFTGVIGIVAVNSDISFSSATPTDTAAQDQIHRLSYVFDSRAKVCGDTVFNDALTGFSASGGARHAVEAIKDLYKTDRERADVLQALADKNVTLHATSASYDDVYAALFNDSVTKTHTLVVQSGLWDWKNFNEPLKAMVEQIRTGDLLEKQGATVIFNNEYQKTEPFLDMRTLPDQAKGATDFSVLPETPNNTKVGVHEIFWSNTCIKANSQPKQAL
jgi:hypothetical protein